MSIMLQVRFALAIVGGLIWLGLAHWLEIDFWKVFIIWIVCIIVETLSDAIKKDVKAWQVRKDSRRVR